MPSTAEENLLFAGRFSPFTLPHPSCSVNRLLFLLFDAEEMTDNAFAEQCRKTAFSHCTVSVSGYCLQQNPGIAAIQECFYFFIFFLSHTIAHTIC